MAGVSADAKTEPEDFPRSGRKAKTWGTTFYYGHKQTERNFTLGGRGSAPVSGKYEMTMGQESAEITVEQELVGKMECFPITPEPLPKPSESADQKMPVITVLISEIMKEIGDPKNNKAYFVLPSQLNGAEYPSFNSPVKNIDEYKFDNTGGPRGQLAVHPAAGQFVLDNASNDKRETGINAVDLILQKLIAADIKADDTEGKFFLRNGYLAVPTLEGEEYSKSREVWEKHSNLLRILIMRDVPATGLNPAKTEMNTGNKHKVNMVYASAVPVNTYNNTYRGEQHKALVDYVAHKVLQAQYYGALYHAAHNQEAMVDGRATVYLMPLGGGVFRNDSDSIARAMSEAVEMLTDALRNKLDIRLLAWEGNNEGRTFKGLLDDYQKLVSEE